MDIFIILRPLILLSVLAVASITDVKSRQVDNSIILLGFAAELAVHLLSRPSFEALSLFYLIAYLMLMFVLFCFGLTGGADFKLYALCAFAYPNNTGLSLTVISIMLAAGYAIAVLAVKAVFAEKMIRPKGMSGLCVSGDKLMFNYRANVDKSDYIPMAVCIFAAAVLCIRL